MANPRNSRHNPFDTRETRSRTSSDAQDTHPYHHRRLSSYGPQESRISLLDRSGGFVNPYDAQDSRVSLDERRRSWISFDEPNESRVGLIDHRRFNSYDTQDSRTSAEFNPYNFVEPRRASNSWINLHEQQQDSRVLNTDRRASANIPDSFTASSPGGHLRPRTISASSFRRSWPAVADAPAVATRPTKPSQSRRTVRRSLPSAQHPPIPSNSNQPFVRSRLNSAPSFPRRASEESRALSMSNPSALSSRASMILYRHAGSTPSLGLRDIPARPRMPRQSVVSNFSRDSIISISADSKYPTNSVYSEQGLIAYAYDPLSDEVGDDQEPAGEDELLQRPGVRKGKNNISVIGFFNILTLIAMTLVMLTIFVIYPVLVHHHDNSRNTLIADNNMVNSSGQVAFALPGLAPNE